MWRAAQTWTGLASPDNNWTTVGNWDTGVPVSGNTAIFNGTGNGNTTINLGGTSQPINWIYYDTANAAAYTIGQTAGDALNFDTGQITVTGASARRSALPTTIYGGKTSATRPEAARAA